MEDKNNDPPEDFRLLSITPTTRDLNDPNPFIRACKIDEAYDSVDHYLDVQFRLLREDFISPLRRGLDDYMERVGRFRNGDLRVYKNVKLVSSKIDNRKKNLGTKVFFGVLKNINWEDSKRFMPGGLLLLTCNNLQSFIFATVLDKDPKDLKQGYVLIEPTELAVITPDMYKATYIMFESKVYFEPYKAVLNSLKLMNEINFPMKEYLVKASTSGRLPRYLEGYSLFPKYDTTWQISQRRRLDSSQYNAFKHALTEEFAVIQGPPGTGKTFIALEIVETLLQNKKLWLKYGPIVVVCFTNHALDQFLEGILKHTKSVLRIGERSKNQTLKPYTLREQRQLSIKNRTSRSGNRRAKENLFKVKVRLEELLTELSNVNLTVNHLTTMEAIVPVECLKKYNFDDQDLKIMRSNEDLVKWLTGHRLSLIFKKSENVQASLPDEEIPTSEVQCEEEQPPEDEQPDDFLELTCMLDVPEGYDLTYPVKAIDSRIATINNKILVLVRGSRNTNLHEEEIDQLKLYVKILNEERETLKREFKKHPIMNPTERPSQNHRWRMYWSWVKRSYNVAVQPLNKLKREYHDESLNLNEARQLVDLEILKKHEIIGMTTSCAARQHVTLQALQSPIVLVEEAAEILESHIVCSMTKHSQHVILIGDHKQLRPKPSDYCIGKDYNLEISLFERMVNIRGNCNQLTCQHRMRPEIVKLITPSIYSTLNNHESVNQFPNIKGLNKNLFFLNHENRESKPNEESWTNQFEAKLLIAFARHLVKQGYEPTDITVLTPYVGQLFELKKEKNKIPILKDLYVTSVDNYQGEENRIILLSLVRNNGEGNIGFLKEENRVCVALSRAREGLYIFGNMNDLIVKNKIWPSIKKTLEDQSAIGESIVLQCQNHPDQLFMVKNPSDFQQCPEGGCLKICNSQLNCGHICTSICHILDKDHEKYQCKDACIKSCPEGHPCSLKCWQGCKPCRINVKCTLKCGHEVERPCSIDADKFPCNYKVKVTLPDCNHKVEKPCYLPIEKFKCTHPCKNRLERCGHSCLYNCHVNNDPDHIEYKCKKPCPKECENEHPCKKPCYQNCGPCRVIMKKERSCGHFFTKILCSEDPEEIVCHRPCKRKLNCGHNCSMKCSETCGNCPKKVNKVSTCGHKVSVKCSEDATPDKCNGPCQKKLQICGHPCKERCKDPCTTKCEAKVELDQPGLCGHVLSVPCYLRDEDPKSPALLKYCEEPCKTQLQCEHLCGGTCGQCLQGRVHVQCMEPCSKILICGHECSIPCREECQPCQKSCETECVHSKCDKKCGLPCTFCNEPCSVGCKHKKCKKRCSQECNVGPCDEPCKKLLKCKHPCVGFCGEPCPPLCRICDKHELTEILFGDEDEPDARFVYLENCGHCIESNGLMQWVKLSDESGRNKSIQLKRCPKCKSLITKCVRIKNQIMTQQYKVHKVKQQIFSNYQKNLNEKQKQLVENLKEMKEDPLISEFVELEDFLQEMLDNGSLVNETVNNKKRKQELSLQEIDAFKVKLNIFEQLLSILSSVNDKDTIDEAVKEQVSLIVNAVPSKWLITKQNLGDVQLELARLHCLIEVCSKNSNHTDYQFILRKVLSINRFTKEYEIEVKEEMRKLNVNITELEREMICKAMNFYQQGHWYECPNGHIYVITECGGAMVEGTCNECNATIGGSDHTLLNSNRVSSVMDGADRPAYPPNLDRFMFD